MGGMWLGGCVRVACVCVCIGNMGVWLCGGVVVWSCGCVVVCCVWLCVCVIACVVVGGWMWSCGVVF